MSLDQLLVIVGGIFGILATYRFFFAKKEKVVEVRDEIDIVVEGGYTPDTISIQKGKKTKLNFLRKDPSSCLEEVVLSEFKVRRFLPLNKKVTVEVTPQKSGEFPFSCGMGMFHGKIVVRG